MSNHEALPTQWRGTGITDIGKVRRSNQDAFAVDDDLGLWVVADGMGGHSGGAEASHIAVSSLMNYLKNGPSESRSDYSDNDALLRRAVQEADSAIRDKALMYPELTGMGTTVVLLHLLPASPMELRVAHVGDSRAYLLRGDDLSRLTRDHSLMEDLVSRGLLSREEAAAHPRRNVLTRAIGIEGMAMPDISRHTLHAEDLLLLCTDGLTGMLNDLDIRDTLTEAARSPDLACKLLVDKANARGGKDNVTVVIVTRKAM
jgi:serine/threonine protein phosphatase PrpC